MNSKEEFDYDYTNMWKLPCRIAEAVRAQPRYTDRKLWTLQHPCFLNETSVTHSGKIVKCRKFGYSTIIEVTPGFALQIYLPVTEHGPRFWRLCKDNLKSALVTFEQQNDIHLKLCIGSNFAVYHELYEKVLHAIEGDVINATPLCFPLYYEDDYIQLSELLLTTPNV